ncbi:GDSL-type esterase/lipase family protein [Maridesulfovibrio hydrothermalis]|uniref:SGNH hydrolase-type esterase domain-containing protein n=1 Tax=Maridesulfovibrio hydrothermalis AM13 = DSM 14728 TaxID=1121451 RepID=L0RAJ7_9BACT|nr:GDSL-type esterase/lipase family protein [Maridesulfovibrio hydrothermalis]CCO23215.1 protein of unknown function [Maridesulfovibrio hydrothermalis AM13 = DSM 14728]
MKESDILLVGDSIIEYGLWDEYLGENFKNRGLGGETTAGLKEWFPRIAEKPHAAIILLIGINNLKSGEKNSINRYLADMYELCNEYSGKAKIFLVGILPINEQMAQEFIHCTNDELEKINEKLKKKWPIQSNMSNMSMLGLP